MAFLILRERPQREHDRRGIGFGFGDERPRGVLRHDPHRCDDGDRIDPGDVTKAANGVEGAWVAPVEVLEAQDDGTSAGHPTREGRDRLEGVEPQRLRRTTTLLAGGLAFGESAHDRSGFALPSDARRGRSKEVTEAGERRPLLQCPASPVEPCHVRVQCTLRASASRRLLPMPASPTTMIVRPVPRRRSSITPASVTISSSRPTSGTSRSTGRSLLPSATAPSTTSRFPFSSNPVVGPHSMLSPSWRLVSGPTSTVPISAAAWSRAAMFTASPVAPISSRLPPPTGAITTIPVSTPTRTPRASTPALLAMVRA